MNEMHECLGHRIVRGLDARVESALASVSQAEFEAGIAAAEAAARMSQSVRMLRVIAPSFVVADVTFVNVRLAGCGFPQAPPSAPTTHH